MRNCPHCDKEVVFRESTVLETAAFKSTQYSDYKTYDIAGIITYHKDGTRCCEELIEYKKLDTPIVHSNNVI